MSEQRETLAEALFDAAFPGEREKDPYWYQAYEHDWYAQADRLLASDALARLLADAEQRGADRVAAAVEALAEEWERTTVRSRLAFLVAADELRAALTTGAADRVRAEHDCETCETCLHNGNKCCGCYDGACCQVTNQ